MDQQLPSIRENGAEDGGLSEEQIKKRFVPFLRAFYKNRYEFKPESFQTAFDNVGEGGIIADGMLQFVRSDGQLFRCTYEASSLDKMDEVRFRQNHLYFHWDCLAFSAIGVAVVYAFFYVRDLNWLVSLHFSGNSGLILGLGAIGFFAWYFLLRNWRKYRYIYAIEQFKKYYADEQWIALGADVFPGVDDPYLAELKRQCIYNGFGLALVSETDVVRPLVTPSRLGIFGKDRKMVEWITSNEWYRTMAQNINFAAQNSPKIPTEAAAFWNRLWRPIDFLLLRPLGDVGKKVRQNENVDFNRFMSSHSVQKWLFGIAVVCILLLGFRVMRYSSENYADLDELRHWEARENPEDTPGYVVDEDPPPPRNGIPKQDPFPVRETEKEGIQTINLSGDNDEGEESGIQVINLSGEEEELRAPVPAEKPAASGCAFFQGKTGWYIQDNTFSSEAFAKERVANLKKAGMPAVHLPKSCQDPAGKGYVVVMNKAFPSEKSAQTEAAVMEKNMRAMGLYRSGVLVRKFK